MAGARWALSASLLKGAPRGDLRIAVDATYSVGKNLSGVGVYSNEIIQGVAAAHPDWRLLCAYRPHRFLRGLRERLPSKLIGLPTSPSEGALMTAVGGSSGRSCRHIA